MKLFLFLLLTTSTSFNLFAKTVRYELTATKGKINLSGKKEVDFALMINNGIPAPVLEFTEGDDAEIIVKNNISDDELSIHWHGILLDPYMDGVPYVNTPPIFPGESHTFKFKIRQHGTYWYHSHTNVQEQKGLFGAIVIHPKETTIKADHDLVLVVSDWSDENPSQILKNLRKDGDYYLYKKGSMRSWIGAMKQKSLSTFLYNEWTRMGGMDFSDVGYDSFLMNGKKEFTAPNFKAHDKIRIRIVNAAASSYFYFSLANIPLKIISLDGVDIKPTEANDFLIGMAETYDLLFEIPEGNKSYELKATAQDGTGSTSAWIGSGEKVYAPTRAMPDMYASMDHSMMDMGTMDHSKMDHSIPKDEPVDHSKMDHSKMNHSMTSEKTSGAVINSFSVEDAEALVDTSFEKKIPRYDVRLVLDGDMERYVWLINGKTIREDRTINIKENEVIRFTFENKTMMHHPMHLHGHFFRVLNKFGDNSPLKHTVDVAPHSTKTIEFYSNEPGEWMLHCHNLYHLKTGMARVVKYSSFTPNSEMKEWQKKDPHMHDHIYYKGMLEAGTNHGKGQLNLMNTWNEIELKAEVSKLKDGNDKWENEGDLLYRRWFGKWTNLVLGGTRFDDENKGIGGVSYILPFLIEAQLLFTHEGNYRIDIEKKFQWSKYIFTDVDFTFREHFETEYEISLMYQKYWSWSAGLMLTGESLGLGAQYNF